MTPEREQEIIAEAKELRASDPRRWTWELLAKHFEVGQHWLRRRIDLAWAEYRRRELRSPSPGVNRALRGKRYTGPETLSQGEIRARRAKRPPDTRDLTGQLLGDPVYEESALARRRARETGKSIAREAQEFMEARR